MAPIQALHALSLGLQERAAAAHFWGIGGPVVGSSFASQAMYLETPV